MPQKILLLLFFTIFFSTSYSQDCIVIDSNTYWYSSRRLPQIINCKDSLGRKQGDWIHYKLYSNKHKKISKSDTIAEYYYGKYKDNLKIGTWVNVDLINHMSGNYVEEYYYAEDTILKTVYDAISYYDKLTLYYNSDSTIINGKYFHTRSKRNETPFSEYPIYYKCNKALNNNEECSIIYRDNIIKKFPYKDFEFELDYSRSRAYSRDYWLVDIKFKK